MSRRSITGRLGLLFAAAGAGLLASGCSADYHGEISVENTSTAVQEMAFGSLQVAGPIGSSPLSYRAACPDGIHYQVEICDENGGVRQELVYEIPEAFVELRNGGDEVWLYADSIVRAEDVNGDGSEDLWLYLGTVGAGSYSYWACYTYDGEKEQYDRVEGFEQLRDPYVDRDGSVGSLYCAGVSQFFWEKYSIQGSRMIPLGKLAGYWMDGQSLICLYDEEVYEDGVLVRSQSGVLGTEVENTALWEGQLKENARQVIEAICKDMQPSALAELSYGETVYEDLDGDGLQDVTYTLIVTDPMWPKGYGYTRQQTYYGSGDTFYVEQGGKTGFR